MAAAFVQKRANYAGTSATTTVVNSGNSLAAITNGNTVIVGLTFDSGSTVSSVTDSGGNTYTADTTARASYFAGSSKLTQWFRSSNVSGAPTSVTTTFGTATSCQMVVYEVSGLTNTSPLGQEPYNSGFSATPSASFTTTTANEIALGLIGQGNVQAFTPGSGWTVDFQDSGNAVAMSRILTTATTYALDGTFASSPPGWAAHGVTYKEATAGGATKQTLLLGVG